ncbi:MAG: HAD family hydrolase [Elainellaceae cyanobacterium]
MRSAILFDLDGTLTNTDPIHFAVWRDVLRPYGLDFDRSFYDAKFSGRLNVDILSDILPQLSAEEAKALSDRKEAWFRERAASELVPLVGLLDLLHWTEEAGVYRGIVTNAPAANANFVIDALNLRSWFPVIVIAEQLAQGKPHPLPYATGLERLEMAAERTIAFEDSVSGIQSAIGAGLFTVGITSSQTPELLKAAGAQHTVPDFSDVTLAPLLAKLSADKL